MTVLMMPRPLPRPYFIQSEGEFEFFFKAKKTDLQKVLRDIFNIVYFSLLTCAVGGGGLRGGGPPSGGSETDHNAFISTSSQQVVVCSNNSR